MEDRNFDQMPNFNDGQDYDTSFPPEDEAVDLANFDDRFDTTASNSDTGFDPVPDGDYQVKIDRVELKRTKKTQEPMIKWTLRIIGPTQKNRFLWKYHVVKTENLGWIKKDLYTCKLVLDKFSDLPNHFDQLESTMLEITKKTKGGFDNIYFNKRLVLDENPEMKKDYEQFLHKF